MFALIALLFLALGSPVAGKPGAQESAPAPTAAVATVTVEIPGSGMEILVPAAWRPGVMRGAGTVLHFLGAGDGFPHFSVQSDSEAQLAADVTDEDVRLSVEGLFDAIVEATSAQVIEAHWIVINGIEVHSSITRRDSVTGPLQMRRLLVVADGIPYVLVWGDRAPSYPVHEALIELCAGSLQPTA